MSNHTPEPWTARIDKYGVDIAQKETGFGICDIGTRKQLKYSDYPNNIADANAHRIVECVNACAGMQNPAEEIQTMRTELAQLRADKARLVELIKSDSVYKLLRYGVKSPSSSGMDCCDDDAYYELFQLSAGLREIQLITEMEGGR